MGVWADSRSGWAVTATSWWLPALVAVATTAATASLTVQSGASAVAVTPSPAPADLSLSGQGVSPLLVARAKPEAAGCLWAVKDLVAMGTAAGQTASSLDAIIAGIPALPAVKTVALPAASALSGTVHGAATVWTRGMAGRLILPFSASQGVPVCQGVAPCGYASLAVAAVPVPGGPALGCMADAIFWTSGTFAAGTKGRCLGAGPAATLSCLPRSATGSPRAGLVCVDPLLFAATPFDGTSSVVTRLSPVPVRIEAVLLPVAMRSGHYEIWRYNAPLVAEIEVEAALAERLSLKLPMPAEATYLTQLFVEKL